jgi:hypothetical protein
MRLLFYTLFFVFINTGTFAQGHFTISGTVTDDKGAHLKSATVFINGSQKSTITNDEGQFSFANLEPGSFQVSAQMLGYFYNSQDVVIQSKSVTINISLNTKSTVLNEVVIKKRIYSDEYYKIFKSQFLGSTTNGRNCTLENPKAVSFTTDSGNLVASSDELLVVINKRLGYKIHYLLKVFKYFKDLTMSYDGDASFEELEGTEKMKKEWAKNRLETYNQSFMHFLRSLYTNTVLKEGFLCYQMYPGLPKMFTYRSVYLDLRPIKFDSLITVADSGFVSFKFHRFYAVYDPKKAAKIKDQNISSEIKNVSAPDHGTIIVPWKTDAIIDRKGSLTNYLALKRWGEWGGQRIGDQLPFEYQPPPASN